MRKLFAVAVLCVAPLFAQDKKFEMTPAIQQAVDAYKTKVAGWAADPKVVAAVEMQNKTGPLAGMDNKTWKNLPRRAKEVGAFQTNDAAKALVEFAKTSGGVVAEAFLNAAKGEKVAFIEKTSSYLHAGSGKFDVPFTSLKAWQGKPEFDESSQSFAVQISVPVVKETKDAEGKTQQQAIGVLVVGLNLDVLGKAATPAK